jgi:hypothetical protein
MNPYSIFAQTQRQRTIDGKVTPILEGAVADRQQLILVWP